MLGAGGRAAIAAADAFLRLTCDAIELTCSILRREASKKSATPAPAAAVDFRGALRAAFGSDPLEREAATILRELRARTAPPPPPRVVA